ncbi:OsmC family protein [Burkholderia cenocepacia]|uniref:OsmC family protein n=1 Tax=Burkholderia cenocepacia TaxID=95486 RepID=UPI0030D91444
MPSAACAPGIRCRHFHPATEHPHGDGHTAGQAVLRRDRERAQRRALGHPQGGKGGDAGLRPHELLESALAACVCMSVELAAERAGVTLPACTVDVTLERRDVETGFDIALRFVVPLSQAQHILVRDAVRASPVARTLGKPIRIGPAAIAHD